jgi:hypothetical protein
MRDPAALRLARALRPVDFFAVRFVLADFFVARADFDFVGI